MPEGSAAPMLNWNERITRESYTPLAFAKRLNGEGNIIELVNCYEWISFNVGPTLMRWMEKAFPAIYSRIIEADKASVHRFGHGNAIAQVYHHTILPLAKQRDKDLEVQWAIQDFEKRFERRPERNVACRMCCGYRHIGNSCSTGHTIYHPFTASGKSNRKQRRLVHH